MKKIRLNLDALTVETFATTKDEGVERGTVRGHDSAASGILCGSNGCETVSDLERCICAIQNHTADYLTCLC